MKRITSASDTLTSGIDGFYAKATDENRALSSEIESTEDAGRQAPEAPQGAGAGGMRTAGEGAEGAMARRAPGRAKEVGPRPKGAPNAETPPWMAEAARYFGEAPAPPPGQYCLVDDAVTVRFCVKYRAVRRQHLCIAGSHEPLGWSFLAVKNVPMTLAKGSEDMWYADVTLCAGALVEYKYCVVELQPWVNPEKQGRFYSGGSAIVRWQPGGNNTMQVPWVIDAEDASMREYGDATPHHFVRCDYWGDAHARR